MGASVGLETSQTGLASFDHMLAATPGVVAAGADAVDALSRHYEALAFALQPGADDLLRAAPGLRRGRDRVDIGDVDEVDAQLCGHVHDRERFGLVALAAEDHGAQAEPAHLQPATAHADALH